MLLSYNTLKLLIVSLLIFSNTYGQLPLYNGVSVSDTGLSNNIGNANTSRNVVVSNDGIIYVVYTGALGIRVSKSTNRGQSFLPSASISPFNAEPEIIVNDMGVVFVSWVQSRNVMLSRSIDQGATFSAPISIGSGFTSVHLAVHETNIYATDKFGEFVYSNSNNGVGLFNTAMFNRRVFADVRTDQNGVVYVPADNPNLFLSESKDNAQSFSSIMLSPPGEVFFSSYALSDSPCGTYIFLGGGLILPTVGYKIDVANGATTQILLGDNQNSRGRTLFADNRGTLIDGYQNSTGELVMNISNDQGQSFGTPIVIAQGGSHNITRNPVTDDIVVVYEQNGQIYVSVYDNLLKSIQIENSVPLTVCSGEVLTIPYTLSNGFNPGTELTFYISDATGNFENKTLIGSIVTNTSGAIDVNLPNTILPGDQYRIQIESQADCVQSNIVDLEVFELPSAIISGTNTAICEGEDANFIITGTINTEVYYNINNSTTDFVILDTVGNATLNVSNAMSDQTLNLERVVNVANGCESLISETITITVNPLPNVNLLDSYLLCVDTNGSETVITPPIIDTFLDPMTYQFEWYLNGSLIPSFSNLTAIFPTEGGDYTVEVSYITTGCSTISNVAQVNESSPPIITSRVTSPAFSDNHVIEVEARNSATFNAISEYEFKLNDGSWILGNGNPGSNYNFTFDQNVRLGVNTIYVRDIIGCGENEVDVIVMDYPLYFTPNGDRIHDTWNITAPESPINYLTSANIFIFDRYGKLLKQLNPTGPGWNGIFNGNLMPTDDYWFVVTFIDPLDNRQRQFRAHFTLKR